MRAREMHNKLDRLSGSVDDGENTCPDISLLSPEDQDRAHELLEKIKGVENEQEFLAKINENTITEAELRELSYLLTSFPNSARAMASKAHPTRYRWSFAATLPSSVARE